MTVTTTNLIQGPASLYWAPFGSTEPATIATAPASPWVDLGGTNDGVTISVKDDWAELTVDQVNMTPERRRTNREVTIKTNLAEATLANLVIALNEPTSALSAGAFTPTDGMASYVPTYGAILLDGLAPGGFKRRFILRKALQSDTMESAYKKDDQTLIPATFIGHWISSSIRPFICTDATS